MFEKIYQKDIIIYLSFIFISFPILLISGPFLSDLLVVFFSIFFLTRYKDFQFSRQCRVFLALISIFYVLINISSILSDNVFLSLKSTLPYFRFIFFSFVISILISRIEKNELSNKYFNLIFQLIFIFLFIDSFYQFFNLENLFGFEIPPHMSDERVSSLFGEELILGSYISKIMFLYLGFLHGKQNNPRNFLNIDFKILFIILITLSTIFISGDRAAFVLAIIGTFIYLFINLNFKAIGIIAVFMAIVFFIIQGNPSYKSRYNVLFQTIFIDRVVGQSTHHQHFKTAYKMFDEKKLFGHGVKSFRNKCNLKKFNSGPKSCSTHPHNYYLQLLSATGIFTFIILAIFFVFILKELIENFIIKIKKNKINNKKICYLISVFIAIFPFATSGSFFNNWISFTIFLSLGFLLSEYKILSYSVKRN